MEAGRSAFRCLPHLSTYEHRERAISTLVTPLALHGVVVASVTDSALRGLETAVVSALWGAMRLSGAKEVVFTVLLQGAPCLSDHAHAVRKGPLTGPGGLTAGCHPGLHSAYLGVWGPPSRDRPSGASAPNGGGPWLEPA